jgi:aminoglycoside phosphotransferase (APT) family kinase protein
VSEDQFGRLSAEQREIAHSALSAAFGAAAVVEVAPVTGGVSALAFRVQASSRNYLLRIEGPTSPLRNPHQYTSMQVAAEAGIAPQIRYLNEAGRIVIMDFVDTQPLQTYPGGDAGLARALGRLLAQLQATRTFPHFVEYPDIVAKLFAYVRRTGLFVSGLLDPHVERLQRVSTEYFASSPRLVSSHNDFHQGNILFDGERLWVVDWESAYRNDPLVDIAIVIDSLALVPELQRVLLHAWLGRAPGEAVRIRLELIRALTRLYFAGVFLSASAAVPRAEPDNDLKAPSPQEFDQAVVGGRISLDTPEARHIMGKMYLASFLSGSSVPSFGGAT